MNKNITKEKSQASIKDKNVDSATLQHLLELGKFILSETDVDRVLASAMDSLIEISGAERGLIILFDSEGGRLFETARNINKENLNHPKFEISRTIIDRVRSTGAPICLRNAHEDPTLKKSNSVARLKILSVICLPLIYKKNLFGVVYLDNRSVMGVFKPEINSFSLAFSDFISLAAYNALERKKLSNHVKLLERELFGKYNFDRIITHDPKMLEILKLVAQIADSNATVLIKGESGTGKELIARALHYNSSRRDKPFIAINSGAMPENLLESELFGHVKGAFTDAKSDKQGWFERADGGTIFFDEVGEMPSALQIKLLRILQTGEYSPVGSTAIRHCNVRILAATNKDLQALIKTGHFREDFYYRINVIDLELPPLRERKDDIPLLIKNFLQKYAQQNNKPIKYVSRAAEEILLSYSYPGNIRELENALERGVSLSVNEMIEPHHLPHGLVATASAFGTNKNIYGFKIEKQRAVEQFERDYISRCLHACNGNITRASKIAGINIKNFYEKMKKYGIDANQFKR